MIHRHGGGRCGHSSGRADGVLRGLAAAAYTHTWRFINEEEPDVRCVPQPVLCGHSAEAVPAAPPG